MKRGAMRGVHGVQGYGSARGRTKVLRMLPVALALALAACAGPQVQQGSPSAPVPGAAAPGAVTAAAGASAPGQPMPGATSRRGGYYLDDGPGQNPPVDLASIPDATPRAEPLLPRTLRPYSVFGQQYTPMTQLEPFRQRGVASWYGRRYHGQPTSSGERYDMYAMTAAHPTLPIPSYVRVTHTGNGRSVVVRVNDRGPFLHGRVIDLSYTAAARLGYVEAGSAEVDVELITQFDGTDTPAASVAEPLRLNVETIHAVPAAIPAAPAGASAAAPERGFWLQFGAFHSLDNARSAMTALARRFAWIDGSFDIQQDGPLYKVQAGPWPRREQALAAGERVRATTQLQPFATWR